MVGYTEKKRYALLDCLRGGVLLSMIGYHLIWDMVYLFGKNWSWYSGIIGYFWQQSICWSFILLSGFCWSIGKKPIMRGLLVFCAGAFISLVTIIFLRDQIIIFGILSFLGASMILLYPLKTLVSKISPAAGILISIGLFFLTEPVSKGYLWAGKQFFLPDWLYQGYFTAFWGFPGTQFYSTDYFPVIPWFFLFLAGYFLYRLCIASWSGKLHPVFEMGYRPLNFLGRHSLSIYMLHQPIIYLCLSIIIKK